jgi:serine/threonine protein kinase
MCNDISSPLRTLKLIARRCELNTEVCAGQGTFGIVVAGEDTILKEGLVFKVEYDGTAITRNEIAAYSALKCIDGIPKFYRTVSFRGHGVLDTVELGCNLDVFMRSSGGSLPVHTVYTLGRQLVQIVRQLHDRGVVHKDIKPHNILLPKSGELKPYLVDFGLAQPFADFTCGQFFSASSGTPAFMSHSDHQRTRGDDIESLAYTLIYLAHGSLPWYDHGGRSECIRQKSTFHVAQLHPRLPHEFQRFLDHATSLQ